jgi:hypothetical protein
MTQDGRDQQITLSLISLSNHYRRQVRTPEEQAMWLRDWLDDLAAWTPDQVADACGEWRRSAARRMPSSGELLVKLSTMHAPKQQSQPKIEAWKPISDEEYDTLSVRDKIRHHHILADQAMLGWKSTTRQVDDDWRRRDAIAKNHRAEASRLGAMLEELI